jgi:FdhD protein
VKEIVCTGGTTRLSEGRKAAIEEISLKVRINGTEFTSLLCLNQLAEELALGFLYSVGVIDRMGDVASISYDEQSTAVSIDLVPLRSCARSGGLRTVTSCSASASPAPVLPAGPARSMFTGKFPIDDILDVMDDFIGRSEVFKTLGGVHSALFRHGEFSIFNEDIGRHNCLDKIAGVLLRDERMELADNAMLFVSGRVSSEVMIKVIRLGVPVLISHSTPTAAAIDLAKAYGVTLLGYVRGTSGFVYSGDARLG